MIGFKNRNNVLINLPFQVVTRTKKIFVGGLSANTVVEDLKNYFSSYGQVSLNNCENYNPVLMSIALIVPYDLAEFRKLCSSLIIKS